MTPAPSASLPLSSSAPLRVALAGNPNCGKTSLFNALTGAHQHVGNYPGVTVERRQGRFRMEALPEPREVELIDLPGTYSLTSYSPEERVARREMESGLDVVVMVADSTNLKRNLVLFAQLMQSGARMVLCLNMADEARAAGQKLDLAMMERLLGVPVVETVGHKGQGLAGLHAAILRAAAMPFGEPSKLVLGEQLGGAIGAIRSMLPRGSRFLSSDFAATRLLAADTGFLERFGALPGGEALLDEAFRQRTRLEQESGTDIQLFITERYFGFVDGLLREVLVAPPRADARALSDQIDSVLVHKFLGLPIFAVVMYTIFWITFTLGKAPMEWIQAGFKLLGGLLGGLWPVGSESLLKSLLVDGIIGGVGGVIVFLPNILLLFFGLAILEDTGYLARAAFICDRLMHRFGLHGKSFIPMLTGFGCSVPGIMATRTLEDEKDRLTTMLVLPLISCGARLPIWLLLVPAFFAHKWQAPMFFFIYFIGIALALILALVLRRSVLKGDDSPFVMELPPYRLPTLKGALRKMLERGSVYLRKAGTVILALSILLWAAANFPRRQTFDADREIAAMEAAGQPRPSPEAIEARHAQEQLVHSVSGRVGHALEPLFKPLGFDWKIVTAMIGAFAAKEVFVAQLGIVYSMLGAEEEGGAAGLQQTLSTDYTPLVGFSLMIFLLISAPCMATIAVTRRESGSWKWALLQLGGLTAIAYLLALTVNQVGGLLIRSFHLG